jgi:hypothetical protein
LVWQRSFGDELWEFDDQGADAPQRGEHQRPHDLDGATLNAVVPRVSWLMATVNTDEGCGHKLSGSGFARACGASRDHLHQ